VDGHHRKGKTVFRMLGFSAAEKSRAQALEHIWVFAMDLDFAPHASAHATASAEESGVELCETAS
jgi:hypothetical protein